MHILFVSNYFPPEVNAPATRLYEHARQWVRDGHTVDVLTSVPNFPEGEVYDGYTNQLTYEEVEGIRVTRVPMYVTANEGVVKRTASYISYMVSAAWYARRLPTPDVVVATSPQFFAACAGQVIARHKEVPFVMEVRDLWPESVVAVGAMDRNIAVRAAERLERFLYDQSDHIVVVTEAFKQAIAEKGVAREKISVIKNGVDLSRWDIDLDNGRLTALRDEHSLKGKFVVSYIGTIGMAHRADVLLEAARHCNDPEVVFMVVGTGAQRDEIEARQAELQLPNFRLVDKVPRETVPYLLALTDVSVVHLRKSPLFEAVIPSKIFEAMATRTPIVLGVEGESRDIIEKADAGIPVPPEDPKALNEAVLRLKSDAGLHARMARNAYEHVYTYFDRKGLAQDYAALLGQVIGKECFEPVPG